MVVLLPGALNKALFAGLTYRKPLLVIFHIPDSYIKNMY